MAAATGSGTQDHARTAAVGRIVDLPVPAPGEVARIRPMHAHEPSLDRLAQEAGPQERVEHLGEQGDELDVEQRSWKRRGAQSWGSTTSKRFSPIEADDILGQDG